MDMVKYFTTHCDVVMSQIGLQCCYFLIIEGDQIIREKKKNEELDDEGWMSDLMPFAIVSDVRLGHASLFQLTRCS